MSMEEQVQAILEKVATNQFALGHLDKYRGEIMALIKERDDSMKQNQPNITDGGESSKIEQQKIMALKNYASTAALPNMFNAIEKTLSSHGAKQIIRDYDDTGRIKAISFIVPTSKGDLGIRLPARYDQVERIFKEQGVRYKPEQPYRTAWATIRDWIDAQMALIDWEMVKPEEVFLPYAIDRSGKTYFEVLESRGFQLGSGTKEGEVIE